MLVVTLTAWRLLRRVQPAFGTADQLRARVAADWLRPATYEPPRSLIRRLSVARSDREGWPVWTVRPERPARARLVYLPRLVYLHGGMYVGEIDHWHWSLIGALADRAPAEVIVPIYPLAGRVGAAEVVATGVRLLAGLRAEAGPLALAGDSAGAGLALAITQGLTGAGGPGRPDALALISPWVDAGCTDPRQVALDRRDPQIRIDALRAAAKLYADGLPLTDPRLSPLNGSLAGLPPTSIWTGTADVLHPDSLRLAAGLRAAGASVDLFTLDDGPHDFPLFPGPEGRTARRELVTWLRGSAAG